MVSEAIFLSASSSNAFIDVIQETGRELEMGVRESQIAAATGGSADVHVQMSHLIEFYNALSELHEQLYAFSEQLVGRAQELNGVDAGGKVAGVATAWAEMTSGIGARGATASMAANLKAVDTAVLNYMHTLNKNAQDYAAQEEIAIVGLDKAAGTKRSHAHKHGKKHEGKSANGGQVKGGAVLQGGSAQVLQGSEQVLQAPSSTTAAHGGVVLGG